MQIADKQEEAVDKSTASSLCLIVIKNTAHKFIVTKKHSAATAECFY